MTPDQQAAIERLRNRAAGGTPYSRYGYLCDVVLGEDLQAVADAYLAEHAADDGEPVTEEWLRSVGFKRESWHPLQLDCDSDIDIRCTPELLVVGHRSDEWDVKANPTRGDVRRLCAAHGCPLNETR